jgi:hypothetical protein
MKTKNLSKQIFNTLDKACNKVLEIIKDDLINNYDIPEEDVKFLNVKEKRKSGYTEFSSIYRIKLQLEATESMTFGEISKKIGKMWNLLSKEEVERYNRFEFTEEEIRLRELIKN